MSLLAIRLRVVLASFLMLVLIFTGLRLAFLGGFGPEGVLRDALTWKAMILGLRYDARLAALCVFPVLVLFREGGEVSPPWKTWLAPWSLMLNLAVCSIVVTVASFDDQRAKPWAFVFILSAILDWSVFRRQGVALPSIRRAWKFYGVTILVGLFLAYAVDAGAFAYIHTRLNGHLFQFLGNPLISLRMIWETYPVLWAMLALAILILGALWILDRAIGRLCSHPSPGRAIRTLQGTIATVGVLALIWGRLGGYPLRWGDAYSLGQGFQTQFALNPVLFLLETLEDPGEDYTLQQARDAGELLKGRIGGEFDAFSNPMRLERVQEPHPLVPIGMNPNIVFIHLESFAAAKTGTFGNPLDPTPDFDRIAKEGILFDRCYSPAENTSRALFSLLFGIADLSPGSRNSATRNPLLADQRTLVNDLDGYSKHYFVAGKGDWAQIRAVLKHNIHGLQVKEEGDFKSPDVDVWGAADADFLHECDGFLDQERGPFFALIQMAGNHPPFTIPTSLGFPEIHPDAEALREAGFTGDQEFNSLRLLDWSLGRFFEEAKAKSWYHRTIFVLYGDHGVSRGKFDPRFGDMALISHHVPMVIYAPGLIHPGRCHTTTSLMDALPTVMSLLGRRVELRGLGKDALNPEFSNSGSAFVFNPFTTPAAIGLLRGDDYAVLRARSKPVLYNLEDPSGKDHSAMKPETTRDLANMAESMRVWSDYLVRHNQP